MRSLWKLKVDGLSDVGRGGRSVISWMPQDVVVDWCCVVALFHDAKYRFTSFDHLRSFWLIPRDPLSVRILEAFSVFSHHSFWLFSA